MGTVIPYTPRHNDERHPRGDRIERADLWVPERVADVSHCFYPGKTFVLARRACRAWSRVGSSPIPTSVLPKFPPSSMARKAFGACASPGQRSSLYFTLTGTDPPGHLVKKVGLVLLDEVAHMQTVHLDVLALKGEEPPRPSRRRADHPGSRCHTAKRGHRD